MYNFSLCISCIWHVICNMMYRHLYILCCMHFVSYALFRILLALVLIRELRLSQLIKRLGYYLNLSWSGDAHSGYGKGWEGSCYIHHSYDAYRTNHSHVVEYRGWTGLSLPASYHKRSVGLGVFQANLMSRHRAYTIDRYFTQRSTKESIGAR
jgi:hypothetical protein